MEKLLLEMKDIEKSFPGVKALSGAQLNLKKGEILALLGENGAGKSTLMNILGGIYKPDMGTIILDGETVTVPDVVAAQKLGIAFIHQEIALVPFLSVGENIFLGREPTTGKMVDRKKIHEEAKQWLDMVGLNIDPHTLVCRLSIAKQQMIEIAKACSLNMKILIMDEPTSSLSEKEVENLFEMMRSLSKRGIGIIYISHKLSEIFEISDRVCIMRDGIYVGTVVSKDSSRDEVVNMMVGRELTSYYTRTYNEVGDVVLKVDGINSGSRLKNCSFESRKGEILGFYGLVGAGRSELLKTVLGLYPKDSGSVKFHGNDITKLSTMQIQERGIVLVPENRKKEGLFLKNTVGFNISISVLKKFFHFPVVNLKTEEEIILTGIRDLRVKTPSHLQAVRNLSGGNQQKVVLAKWIASEPEILILDEPTRGVDVGAKAEIYSIMNDLAAQGKCIIMISSEMPEMVNMCDRMFVMSNGRITAELDRSEFEQSRILHYAVAEEN